MSAATLSRDVVPRLLATFAAVLAAIPIAWWYLSGSEVGLTAYTTSVLLAHGAGVFALLIACALIWKAWHAPGGPALAVFLIAFCLYNGGIALAVMLGALLPATGGRAYNFVLAAGIATGIAALIRFSAQFPGALATPAAPGANVLVRFRERLASKPTVGAAALLIALVLVLDAILLRPSWYVGSSRVLIHLFMIGGFGVASANLWIGYMHSGVDERRKILWVGQGVVMLAMGVTLPLGLWVAAAAVRAELPRAIDWYVLTISELAFVLCLAFAVFGRGAIDPALLFRRTSVAGAMTVLGLFLFSGIENLATDLITSTARLPSWAGTWIAGGVVALAFAPLYRWAAKAKR